ncbi:MAG: hypothetical protein KDA62_16290 [Planctomycetales bacterium]|nr:hypothetical protein [Planctomycetales bacterium]
MPTDFLGTARTRLQRVSFSQHMWGFGNGNLSQPLFACVSMALTTRGVIVI